MIYELINNKKRKFKSYSSKSARYQTEIPLDVKSTSKLREKSKVHIHEITNYNNMPPFVDNLLQVIFSTKAAQVA